MMTFNRTCPFRGIQVNAAPPQANSFCEFPLTTPLFTIEIAYGFFYDKILGLDSATASNGIGPSFW
ncbi:hypothetical protein [Dyadobacter frigoris]|uniref:Uncharacterized protein n=1 Tax=Dyadobacter frigoris TaxID=2576211 RepID=A0A4V6BIY3_9BACT|nr:hypothetical protein [Dyadobacter frigoris]TKT92233.1 hypothetical protein FDK13_09620 [Dyadobacter frigoris]